MVRDMSTTVNGEDLELELAVRTALQSVFDPEIPTLSVIDLGMVEDVHCAANGRVQLRMMPTFMGCPALLLIENNIRKAIIEVDGVTSIDVEFVHSTPWTSERITDEGREKLREFGIAPPQCGLLAMKQLEAVCPYCQSTNTQLDNLFGPTACRAIFHCNDCRQPFEAMKPV